MNEWQDDGPNVLQLAEAKQGHFLLESGHHGNLWLPLERLFITPQAVRPLITRLSKWLRSYHVEAVCGPLVEGAFVALQVAQELQVPFYYSVPQAPDRLTRDVERADAGLFPVRYVVPSTLKSGMTKCRMAIVNDVINAGSAVRGTLEELSTTPAQSVVIATLLTLGDSAKLLARAWNLPLVTLEEHANEIWTAEVCPYCALGQPLDDPDIEA